MIRILYFSFMLSGLLLIACNNNESDNAKAVMKDPSEVHPPSQAIPDSMQIVNDSNIKPI